MKRRRLGRSGLVVSEICLGTMTFGSMAGRTEEIVGKWLRRHSRDAVIVATKIAGPGGGWFPAVVRNGKTTIDRHAIERAVDDSLRRLGTD